jgi:hypothetical protein
MWALLLSFATKIPMLFTPLAPLFAGFNIAAFFGGLWSNIKKYWREWLIGLFVFTQLGTAFGWYHEHGLLAREKASHVKDINDFKTAQVLATAQANAEKSVLQKESKANADQADAKYTGLLAQYRANLLRYSASQSGTSTTHYSQLPTTQSGNGPSTGTDVSTSTSTIQITIDDAQICAVNTARLQAVHDWAINPPKDGTNP